MHVACPHCGQVHQGEPRLAGQLVTCPICGQQFQIDQWPKAPPLEPAFDQRPNPSWAVSNVLLTLILATLLVIALPVVCVCGGCWYYAGILGGEIDKARQESGR